MSVQSEMKLVGGSDTAALKQHFGKKIAELEDEKRTVQVKKKFIELFFNFHTPWNNRWLICTPVLLLQKERDHLLTEIENLASNSDGQTQKLQDVHAHKLKSLEAQVMLAFVTIPYKYHNLIQVVNSLHNLCTTDSGSQEKTREPGSTFKAETKEWWSSKAVARWNSIYKGSKG